MLWTIVRSRTRRAVRHLHLPVVVAIALLAPAVEATRAPSPSTPRWGGDGSSVSGTIVTANARELVVATTRGERIVLRLVSHTAELRNGTSFTAVARGKFVTALPDAERSAARLATERMDLLPWVSSSPLILPILALLALGTAGAVAIGRRMSPIFT